MRHMRIPWDVRGPFASAVDGTWKSHRTADAAWRRVWPHRDSSNTHAVRVVSRGRGERLTAPPTRPPGGSTSGPGGSTELVAVFVRATPEERDSYDARARAAGLSRSEWIRSRLRAD